MDEEPEVDTGGGASDIDRRFMLQHGKDPAGVAAKGSLLRIRDEAFRRSQREQASLYDHLKMDRVFCVETGFDAAVLGGLIDQIGGRCEVNLASVRSLLGNGVRAAYVTRRRANTKIRTGLDTEGRVVVAVFDTAREAQMARMKAHRHHGADPEVHPALFEYSNTSNPAMGGWPSKDQREKLLIRAVVASSPDAAVTVGRKAIAMILQGQQGEKDVRVTSESRSANAQLIHVNGEACYNVWITVFGLDRAKRAAEGLRGSDRFKTLNRSSKIWVGGFCGACDEWGHDSNARECTRTSYLVRVDSTWRFNAKFLKRLKEFTGATAAFPGAYRLEDGRSRNPKTFAHLKYATEAARGTALVYLVKNCVANGMLSRMPRYDALPGVPSCCSACGLMDEDCTPGSGLKAHKSYQSTACLATRAGKEAYAARTRTQGNQGPVFWEERDNCWVDRELSDRFRNLDVSGGASSTSSPRRSPSARRTGTTGARAGAGATNVASATP